MFVDLNLYRIKSAVQLRNTTFFAHHVINTENYENGEITNESQRSINITLKSNFQLKTLFPTNVTTLPLSFRYKILRAIESTKMREM